MPRLLAPTFRPRPPRRRRGASTTEYVLVVGLIVIPLALLVPGIVHMIVLYFGRIVTVTQLPLG